MIIANTLHYFDEEAKKYRAYSPRELTEKIVWLEKEIKELKQDQSLNKAIDAWRSGYQKGYSDATETAVNIVKTNLKMKE